MTVLEQRLVRDKQRFESLSADDCSEAAKRCIATLGGSYRALGQWDQALQVFDIGLSRCQKARDVEGVSEFLIWKSNLNFHMGRYGRAIELGTQAVSMKIPDELRAGRLSYHLANAYLMLGDIERYVELQREAMEIAETLQDTERKARTPWIKSQLAKGLDLAGQSQEANELIAEQVSKFRELKHAHGLPMSVLILGANLRRRGRFSEAEQALSEALDLYRKGNREGFVVDVLVELSQVALAQGDCAHAKLHAEEAIEEARKGPRITEGLADTRHLNQALVQGARVYARCGQPAQSRVCYQEAMGLALGTNRKLMLAELLDMNVGRSSDACPKRDRNKEQSG